MLVVNFYGGPGVRKSTMAANLFSELKYNNVNCELVREYAKGKVWEKSLNMLTDRQLYIFAKQNHELDVLRDKVDVAITDSPLLLSLIYDDKKYSMFPSLVKEVYKTYNNLNFLLIRQCDYNTSGRTQTKEEAIEKDQEILDMLRNYNDENDCWDSHKVVMGAKGSMDFIYECVMKQLQKG